MDHAVQASEGSSVALAPMGIKFLLGKDVSTSLTNNGSATEYKRETIGDSIEPTSQEKETMASWTFSCRVPRLACSSQSKSNRTKSCLLMSSEGRRRVTASFMIGSESGGKEGQLIN